MWGKAGKKRATLLAVLAVAALATMPAQAARKTSNLMLQKGLHLPAVGETQPPVGFLDFCDRYPRECRPLGTASEWKIRLTPQRWALLKQVNLFVNRKVRPQTDMEIYNRPEVWEYPTAGVGDCEDYVLLKKRYLEGLGFPAEALLITVLLDENGGGHAVLLARTDRGDLVLDNRRDRILPWHRTGYTYLMRQSQRDPGRWVALTRDPNRKIRIFGQN